MLYPSVDVLKTKIDSKYSLVSLAAKRARAMQEGSPEHLSSYISDKNVGKALEEVAAGVLTKEDQDETKVYEDEV
ncbi:DNA-directed RNA polymerase subunit omega [Rummeliibacillus pycnus]|uniref:DNA-directed RNA polymerase subunit omega n=1 Tax=Rummeliibacillus pycnus TaxID=101070 RepID=UPI000C998DB6|nr:DNA-directed RNA polymerase subunit omega [Rummeliibacillus pycnus]